MKKINKLIFLELLGLVIGVIILFFILQYIINKNDRINFSNEIDDLYSLLINNIYKQYTTDSTNIKKHPYTYEMLEEIVQHFKIYGDIESDIKIYLNKSTEINAFALPGDIISVNIGLIRSSSNINEIASVIAHEIGHIEKKHIKKMLLTGIGIEFLTGGNNSISYAVSFFSSNAYSRELEKEADDYAIKLMLSSKMNPEHFSNFFNKIKSISVDIPEFISTHPDINNRINKAQNSSFNSSNEHNFEFDLEEIKNELY